MRHSTERIRATHGGNLPRPAAFDALLQQGPVVTAEVAGQLPGAVQWVVDAQLDCGVDVVNDGEYVKAAGGGSYSGYIHQRVTGWEVRPVSPGKRKRDGVGGRERRLFPGFYESGLWLQGSGGPVRPGFFKPGVSPGRTTERVATGPLAYTGHEAVKADIDALTRALAGKPAEVEGFVAALGPKSPDRVDRLRGEADMAHHRHAALDQERDGLGHAAPAFELDGAAAGLLQHARAGREGLLPGLLVAAERHVDHDQSTLRAAHHRMALQDHHIERDWHRGLEPVHDHTERIADQNHIAIAIDQAGRMGVVGGETHDRLPALAGADLGRGDPLDVPLRRHAQLPNTGNPIR